MMILGAFLATAPLAALAEENCVVMLAKDGTSYSLPIKDVNRINFGAAQVELLGNNGESNSLAYGSVDRILLNAELTAIDQIRKGDIAVYPTVTTGTLTVAGVEKGTEIAVFDLSGRCVEKLVAASETLSLNLSSAAPGALIVKVGTRSVKIIKK